MSVRALRRLTKAEAFVQFQQRPATNISAAARQWGCSRSTVRQWIAEFTVPPVATVSPPPDDGSSAIDAAMATPPAATDAAMAAPPSSAEAVKIALSALCDSIEDITPEALVDSADDVEVLGLHGDAQLAASWLAAVEREAEAAIKRRAR
jgi:transposase-like protein